MAWEKFSNVGSSFRPRISIRSNGHLGFTRGAVSKFRVKDFSHAILYFDRDTRKVAVVLCNKEERGVTNRVVKRDMDCHIRIKSFLDYYDIDYSTTKVYDGEIDGDTGWIVVDLNKPAGTRRRGKKSSQEGGGAMKNE